MWWFVRGARPQDHIQTHLQSHQTFLKLPETLRSPKKPEEAQRSSKIWHLDMSCTERRTHQAAFHLKSATYVIPGWTEENCRNPTASWTFLNILEQMNHPWTDSKLLHTPLVCSQGAFNVSSVSSHHKTHSKPHRLRIHPHPFPYLQCLDLLTFSRCVSLRLILHVCFILPSDLI